MWPFSRSARAQTGRHGRRDAARPRLTVELLEERAVPSTVPNDPTFAKLWGMEAIHAPEAWDLTTGSTKVVVAVIDDGVDYTHADLYKNIWLNQAEIPREMRRNLSDVDSDGLITFWDLNESVNQGPGKITDLNGTGHIDGGDLLRPLAEGGWADGRDEGNNGYVDDLVGWDFGNNDNDPRGPLAHGTHVAGTIGAVGNNGVGVTGVNWKVQIMPVKYYTDVDTWTVQNVFDAIYYAVNNGARVSNNSYGAPAAALTEAERAAGYALIQYAASKDHVFVAAAHNQSSDNDLVPVVPASYDLPNIIAVAATTVNDRLAHLSNYGATSVDLGAPGVNVWSTVPGSDYANYFGTSMATPHVAGAAALILARNPNLSHAQVKALILDNVDPLQDLAGKTVTGGRLNLFKAVSATPPATAAPATGSGIFSAASAPVEVIGSSSGSGYALAGFQASVDATSHTQAASWSIQIGTAPHALTNEEGLPQDDHLTAKGSNTSGWSGGGVLTLGILSQVFDRGQHITLQLHVVEAGIIGVDGNPVPAGTYVAPSPEVGDRTFEVESGRTFYVIYEATVVNSNVPGYEVGTTFRLMHTFDALEGRHEQETVLWVDFGFGFFPFLNEGVMMTNLHSS